jgi:hypothetical protein
MGILMNSCNGKVQNLNKRSIWEGTREGTREPERKPARVQGKQEGVRLTASIQTPPRNSPRTHWPLDLEIGPFTHLFPSIWMLKMNPHLIGQM